MMKIRRDCHVASLCGLLVGMASYCWGQSVTVLYDYECWMSSTNCPGVTAPGGGTTQGATCWYCTRTLPYGDCTPNNEKNCTRLTWGPSVDCGTKWQSTIAWDGECDGVAPIYMGSCPNTTCDYFAWPTE
jgi:hypothetical protein